jgi:hypothetical protein
MPFEASWYHNLRVIYWRVWGQVTLEEIAQIRLDQQKLLGEGTSPIHTISNITDVASYPTDIRLLKEALDGINHPHIGWVLIVGTTTPLKRFVTTTVTQLVIPNVRLRMFNRMDEAVEFLKHVDNTAAVATGDPKAST